jgi:hypothetical protein
MTDCTTTLRWAGNFLLIIGYGILLYADPKLGLVLKLIGGALLLPSFYRHKMWDGIGIAAFFAAMEGYKLVQLLITK